MDNNFNENVTTETVEAVETVETFTAEVVTEAPAPEAKSNLGLISMICGIASVVLSCCCGALGMILGIAAIVLAIIERNKTKRFSKFALAGLICGIAGIIFFGASLIINIVTAIIGAAAPSSIGLDYDIFEDLNGYYYY